MIKKILQHFKKNYDIDNSSTIGGGTYIGKYSMINNSIIGKYCSIGPGVIIGQYDHYYKAVTTHPFINHKEYGFLESNYFPQFFLDGDKGSPIIDNDVWIGANAIICRGVHIHNGAVIGAGAVVTKDIPEYAIAVGNPAKVIKYRFDENTIKVISRSEWWNWDKDTIKNILPLMYETDEFVKYILDKENKK